MEGRQVLSVAAVTALIKAVIAGEGRLQQVLVRGQVANWKRHTSGHCYFSLQDGQATIRAVMFRSQAARLRFAPENGMAVVASGSVNVYERDGNYQLYCDYLAPDGVGEQQLSLERLKAKLAAEGLFDRERKRQLPAFPQAIGIITSPTGAAINDIVKVISRRFPAVRLYLHPVQVQGESAPSSIVRALEFFAGRPELVDILIVGRGGGGQEDMAAFNDERVVRAVAAARVPVISAVGHEHDYCLCDFAADVRAATPSQAAELAVPATDVLYDRLRTFRRRLQMTVDRLLVGYGQRLAVGGDRLQIVLNRMLLPNCRIALDRACDRLQAAIVGHIGRCGDRIRLLAGKLAVLNPLLVKKRGYALVYDAGGRRLICKAGEVTVGENIHVELAQGSLTAEVRAVNDEEAGQPEEGRSERG
ncbi:MAG: exodeoxyribonuclease VII large subunit [Negativicutes bacterium]|nr:exodeoxyribonuclease VII large subunit [Negativicutes bacterium]